MTPSWVAEAERVLCRLRDVEAAAITTDGDQIREIHIVAISSTRAPKHIVRDVETALKAFLKRSIDHRMISVALQAPAPGDTPLPVPPAAPAAAPAAPPPPARVPTAPPAAVTPLAMAALSPADRSAEGSRVRFVNANLFVSGLRTQAEVELSWQGTTRVGNATGASGRDNANRLLSGATLAALAPFLGPDVTLAPHDVEFVRLGRQEVVVVSVKLLAQRSEKTLVGACTVEQDMAQSVVYATLAAANRVLAGLRTVEPVEYELRPAST
jgi:hypothetical protein